MFTKCIFIGSKWALANFKSASETIPFMPIYQDGLSYDWDTEYAFVSGYKNVGINWDYELSLTLNRAETLHENDILYGTFTINSIDNVMDAFAKGVDFVTTDTVLPSD